MHHEVFDAMPLTATLGIELDDASPSAVRGHLTWSPHVCTVGGVIHGGTFMAFADSLGGFCAWLNMPEGAKTATIESKTNFFRAIREGTLHGVSQPLHIGRTTVVVQTDLSGDDQRLAARITQTQAVLPGTG